MKKTYLTKSVPSFVLALAFGLLSGCARMELSRSNLKTQVQVNTFDSAQYQLKNSFKEERWNHYFLWQLAPTARPNLEEMVGSHVSSGEMVTDLQVKKKITFVNGLICALVGFIYCPDTLTVEGNVVTKIVK